MTVTPDTLQIPRIPLASGTTIPQLGFGTYKVVSGVYEAIRSAIDLGYRHIDTAQMYGNEAEVGRALADCGVDRSELFITSKLRNDAHEPAEARRAFEQTLRDLRTEYVDLFLIHWPLPMHYGGDLMMPWKALESFYDQGTSRAIGVSNYQINHLQEVLDQADVAPHVNQIEVHPQLHNDELRAFHQQHGIITEAWSPLARGRVFDNPVLMGIAQEHEVSVAQVTLRWAFQRGDVIFPKASTVERQAQNLDIFGFELTDEQVARIAQCDLGEGGRTGSHPDTMDRLKL